MEPNNQLPYLWIFALLLFAGGVAAAVWAAATQHPMAITSAIMLSVCGLALLTLARSRRRQTKKERPSR